MKIGLIYYIFFVILIVLGGRCVAVPSVLDDYDRKQCSLQTNIKICKVYLQQMLYTELCAL